jgi:hypothetical protein
MVGYAAHIGVGRDFEGEGECDEGRPLRKTSGKWEGMYSIYF